MDKGALVGRILKDYKLLTLIGDGGFGEVYRAQNIRHNKHFAVKILHSHLVKSENIIQRFYGEARTLAALNHPNIVQMVDFDKEDGVGLYLVLEWLRGTPLSTLLRQQKGLSLAQTLRVFRQLLAGLQEAHGQGIVHRDLKPANLMMLPSGDAHLLKIFDFGIALDLGETRQTQTGMLMGSVRYMSPEQAMGNVKEIDHRTDLYACGVILAECLTGQTPFNGASAHAVVFQHVQDAPAPLSALARGRAFPPQLEAIYQKALAKHPAQRFQSAQEFLQALQTLSGDTVDVTARGAAPTDTGLPVFQGQILQTHAPNTPVQGSLKLRMASHSTAPEAFDETALPTQGALANTSQFQASTPQAKLPTAEAALSPGAQRSKKPAHRGPSRPPGSSQGGGLFQRRAAVQAQRPASSTRRPAPQRTHRRSAEASEEQRQLARECLHAFSQALRNVQLYIHQDEGQERFFKIALQRFEAYHRAFGHLSFSVKPFELFLGGESIYLSDDEEGGIAYKLFHSGIRVFTFQAGTQPDDLVRVARLFLLSPKALKQEDMVSRLWKASIPHIDYFQIQMNEDGEEEDLSQLLSYAERFAGLTNESRSTVNFRVFSQDDARAEQLWRASHTYRQLFQELPPPSQEEVDRLLGTLTRENEAVTTRGSQLLFLLLKQHKESEPIEHLQEYLTTLCDHLFFHRAFGPLGMLLQQVKDMAQAAKRSSRLSSLLEGLLARAASEERTAQLFAHLRERTQMTEAERRGIRVFLTLLGARIQRSLMAQLNTPIPMLRRVLLEALLHGASQPQQLAQSLLKKHHQQSDFLVDLLYAGREIQGLFALQQLEECLTLKEHRVQLQALSLLARQYPASLPDVAPRLLQDPQPSVQRRVIEALCQLGESSVSTVLSYVESKPFRKLAQPIQQEIFSLVGESRHPLYLDWFRGVLAQKSSLLRPGLDHQKRLVIRGLRSYGGPDARRILREAAAAKGQARAIRSELENTYQNLVPF